MPETSSIRKVRQGRCRGTPRLRRSWGRASCFEKLQSLQAAVLLAASALDETILHGIIGRYTPKVRNPTLERLRVLEGAPHALDLWLRGRSPLSRELASEIRYLRRNRSATSGVP